MNKTDPALSFSNPRLVASVYFGLLSVVGTILINALLTIIGIQEIVPLFQAILLGMVVASITGALFGKSIIHCPKPYIRETFLIGFIMVIVSLPFFDIGLLYFMNTHENQVVKVGGFHHFGSDFLMVLGYSYILFGILLAIACGLASVYLRGYFVYQILKTDKRQSHSLPRYITKPRKTKAPSKKQTLQQKKT